MILVVCGPSGVGKSTILRHLMARRPQLAFSVSHTTRAQRPGERDGVDYHYVDDATFDEMVAADAFAEHAGVHDRRYGTSKAELAEIEASGRDAALDVDYQGAEQIARSYPEAVLVMVVPPSIDALVERLRRRGTETEAQVAIRLAKARLELSHYPAFRYVVVNDRADSATDRLDAIYLAEQAKVGRNLAFLNGLVGGGP